MFLDFIGLVKRHLVHCAKNLLCCDVLKWYHCLVLVVFLVLDADSIQQCILFPDQKTHLLDQLGRLPAANPVLNACLQIGRDAFRIIDGGRGFHHYDFMDHVGDIQLLIDRCNLNEGTLATPDSHEPVDDVFYQLLPRCQDNVVYEEVGYQLCAVFVIQDLLLYLPKALAVSL